MTEPYLGWSNCPPRSPPDARGHKLCPSSSFPGWGIVFVQFFTRGCFLLWAPKKVGHKWEANLKEISVDPSYPSVSQLFSLLVFTSGGKPRSAANPRKWIDSHFEDPPQIPCKLSRCWEAFSSINQVKVRIPATHIVGNPSLVSIWWFYRVAR